MNLKPRPLLAAAALLGFFTVGADARADSKQECAAAYEKTQALSESGHLLDARREAVTCSASTCSIYVVKDCAQWLADIDKSLPTVVFAIENAAAINLLAVRVTVDGQPVAEALDGKPVPLDPGEHVVRFEMLGSEPVEQKVTLQMGAKNRVLTASFKPTPPPPPPTPPAPVAPPRVKPLPASPPPVASPPPASTVPKSAPPPVTAPHAGSNQGVPLWAWASGSAGVVALSLAAGFGAGALHAQRKLVTACGGNPALCPADTKAVTVPLADQRTRDRNIFLALGAVGLVGIGVAVVGVVTAPSKTSSPRASILLAPFGSPSSGGVEMQGWF